MDIVTNHPILTVVLFYVFQAAASSLPEGHFEFYPWFLHTVRLLANSTPPVYKLREPEVKP